MKQGALVTIIAAGAVFGWFAPDIAGERTVPAAVPGPATATAAPSAHLNVAQWNNGEEVLPRNDDGHFYADVTVEGATAQMLVDTGASTVALTGADAAAMGLQWDDAAVEPVARGASGLVYGVRVNLPLVQLGQLEARDVEAVVVPEGLDVSLLGQSFLSKVGRVEMAGEAMVLGG
jgi:aspartyl protease family protein